jgi:hypothetical protein
MEAITPQPQEFIDYVRRLERQDRRIKIVGLVLFLLCFSTIGLTAWQVRRLARATAYGGTKVIGATQFNLLDENGKTQGMLTATSGGAMVFLNGPNDKVGLQFNPGEGTSNGSSLSLMSSSDEQQVTRTQVTPFRGSPSGQKRSLETKSRLVQEKMAVTT